MIWRSSSILASYQKNLNIFYLLNFTWHLIKTKSACSEVDVKNYLYVLKPTWNLFLQAGIWKLMHNSVKTSYLLSFKQTH